jgi:hypothetical protein
MPVDMLQANAGRPRSGFLPTPIFGFARAVCQIVMREENRNGGVTISLMFKASVGKAATIITGPSEVAG